uniref:phosphoprotein associated with glycosphingolipid-enriched microdomains 1 n=1 Tax=Doryrhamphus excisus TaxID=161450 RepID=UPI0025AE24CF|nr:phosphoprotein associated with glycosphingolipid-enriched microdomains 1 [Doryrhamphus excisus]
MAPVLTGVWWGPEAGVVWSGAAAAGGGEAANLPGGGQLLLAVTLSALAALLLVSVVLLLCTSCQGQKKAVGGPPAGDRVDLMDGTSDKEAISQSPESPVTDVGVSSSHNGPRTSGTILTEASSPHPSEDIPSSQSEHRSSKCPQDRELPSIPANGSLIRDAPPPSSGDSTYEVVKDMAATSRDISIEDSLYETVKELKDPPKKLALANGTAAPSPLRGPLLLNGHVSPSTVEYASVDRNKKSRNSADLEAKRRSADNNYNGRGCGATPACKEPDDLPPPVPEKVLDENDNQAVLANGVGAVLHNGKLHSPPSPAPGLHNKVPSSDNEPSAYSSVDGTNHAGANPEDKEHDYSSIAELKGLIPAGSSSDLYATVHDVYARPGEPSAAGDGADPGYESIRIPKTGSSDEERREGEGAKAEPDYESVGELGLSRETSRL